MDGISELGWGLAYHTRREISNFTPMPCMRSDLGILSVVVLEEEVQS